MQYRILQGVLTFRFCLNTVTVAAWRDKCDVPDGCTSRLVLIARHEQRVRRGDSILGQVEHPHKLGAGYGKLRL